MQDVAPLVLGNGSVVLQLRWSLALGDALASHLPQHHHPVLSANTLSTPSAAHTHSIPAHLLEIAVVLSMRLKNMEQAKVASHMQACLHHSNGKADLRDKAALQHRWLCC